MLDIPPGHIPRTVPHPGQFPSPPGTLPGVKAKISKLALTRILTLTDQFCTW